MRGIVRRTTGKRVAESRPPGCNFNANISSDVSVATLADDGTRARRWKTGRRRVGDSRDAVRFDGMARFSHAAGPNAQADRGHGKG